MEKNTANKIRSDILHQYETSFNELAKNKKPNVHNHSRKISNEHILRIFLTFCLISSRIFL